MKRLHQNSTMRLQLGWQCLALVTIVCILFSAGCATIPKEVVELSYIVGQDLNAVHASYKVLIKEYFDTLRAQTNTFINERWTPTYLKDWIVEGELLSSATGPDPSVVLEDVGLWAEVAIEDIEIMRRSLLDPIDEDEKELTASVDEAFAQLIRANATITSHLNSLRKVQEVQDEALEALNIKDLRDKINDKLVEASNKAAEAIERVKEADGVFDELVEKKNSLIGSEGE